MQIKKTALYDIHKKLGAKIVNFAGYYMPIQYKGIMEEHRRVRSTVGMFDVSHMGEFEISGENAEKYLQKMTINDVSKLNDYQVQYSALCYEDGGIIDDLLIYRYPDHFMVVVNASNLEKDFLWMQDHLIDNVTLKNCSDDFTLLAIQGKNASDVLQKLTAINLDEIKYYWLAHGVLADVEMMIARTGYTGEDGFEIMFATQHSEKVWQAVIEAGKEFYIEPVGLAARDTLRLEVKFCLYGNDIDNTTNPLEAGLGWITKLKCGEFIGRDALIKIKEKGLTRKLIGFEIMDKAIARKGYEIFIDNQKIGYVTSGAYSPILEKSIGMGYVEIDYAKIGTRFDISIRGKKTAAEVIKPPFYKRPY